MTLKSSFFSIFFEVENIYNDPKEKYPIKSTTKDNKNCFLSFTNQYNRNSTFIKTRNETPKLSTESPENVSGGKNGKTNDNNNKTDAKALM